MASKSHCTIVPANGDYAVVDTGSTNGTYVAGEKINVKKKLEHGDSITLGRETNHLLIFLEG
jgi:pSer/pThr/pTyr-binding forkhead associated (FHA) protein